MPRRPHEGDGGAGGRARVERDPRGQRNGLVEHRAGLAHRERQPELDQLGRPDPVGGEQHACRALPSHDGGEEEAAGGLGRHTELGEGHAQPGGAVDQHEVAMSENGEAQPYRHAVDGGQERDRYAGEQVEQTHEAAAQTRARSPDGRAGGEGGHLGQVGARGEGAAAPGEHDGSHHLVLVRGAQGGIHVLVHGGVEGVAHLGPGEGQDPHTGCGVLDLNAAHRLLLSPADVGPPSLWFIDLRSPSRPVDQGRPRP